MLKNLKKPTAMAAATAKPREAGASPPASPTLDDDGDDDGNTTDISDSRETSPFGGKGKAPASAQRPTTGDNGHNWRSVLNDFNVAARRLILQQMWLSGKQTGLPCGGSPDPDISFWACIVAIHRIIVLHLLDSGFTAVEIDQIGESFPEKSPERVLWGYFLHLDDSGNGDLHGLSNAGQAALKALGSVIPENQSPRFALFEELGLFSKLWESKLLQSHHRWVKKPSGSWKLQPPHATEDIKFKWDGHGDLELKIQAEITDKHEVSETTGVERLTRFAMPFVMKIFYKSEEARPNVFEQLQAFQLYVPPRPRAASRDSFYYRLIGIVRLGAPGEPDMFRVYDAWEAFQVIPCHNSFFPGTWSVGEANRQFILYYGRVNIDAGPLDIRDEIAAYDWSWRSLYDVDQVKDEPKRQRRDRGSLSPEEARVQSPVGEDHSEEEEARLQLSDL